MTTDTSKRKLVVVVHAEGEVRSEEGEKGHFHQRTTVLPLSGRVGLPTETFLESAGRPLCRSRVPRHLKWQDRRIIPV